MRAQGKCFSSIIAPSHVFSHDSSNIVASPLLLFIQSLSNSYSCHLLHFAKMKLQEFADWFVWMKVIIFWYIVALSLHHYFDGHLPSFCHVLFKGMDEAKHKIQKSQHKQRIQNQTSSFSDGNTKLLHILKTWIHSLSNTKKCRNKTNLQSRLKTWNNFFVFLTLNLVNIRIYSDLEK